MQLPGPNDKMQELLAQRRGQLFAVMDGGAIKNLQGKLHMAGLAFRPLYLDEENAGALAAGPHIVPCPTLSAAADIRAIADGKTAIVWWDWPGVVGAAEEALFQHLRRLNMVEIPTDRPDAGPADPEMMNPEPAAFEAVLFRHADPSVMALVLPLLRLDQWSKVFGEAIALIFDAGGRGGPSYVPRRPDFTPPQKGLLRIEPDQYARLVDALGQEHQGELLAYVNTVFEGDPQAPALAERKRLVAMAEAAARKIKFRTKTGDYLWSFLVVFTLGKAITDPKIYKFIEGSKTPDLGVRQIVDLLEDPSGRTMVRA